jgi:RNA-binding protein YhbY
LTTFTLACDADLITLAPRGGVTFTSDELKALLAYLNSSFAKLYFEASGRTAGGVAALALETNVLEDMPILDVKSLPKEDVEHLARLFDKLEAEARRLGGADRAESIFGSELAKDLTGREDVEEGVPGLFNTVIREIDEKIAAILQVEALVERVREMVVELARRLSRAVEAKPSALKGSEEQLYRRSERKGSRAKKADTDARTTRLTDFM